MSKLEILDKIEKIVYVTQPSPVVLVSTISKIGINNLAPIAMFMNCSSRTPYMLAIAISPKTDTYNNIKETKEFIVGIPYKNMLKKLYKAGAKFDATIDEFEVTGLTPYVSKQVSCKRIMECCINIDCVFEKELETGNHHIIVGKVVGCDIESTMYKDNKIEQRSSIPRIYHITDDIFTVDNNIVEITKEDI